MPYSQAKLDFASGQQSSNEELAGAIPQSVNILVDSFGAMHVRPGISAWADFAKPPAYAASSVDAMVPWNGYLAYVTADRYLHAQLAPGSAIDLSDGTAATLLDGSSRPVLVATRTRLIATGGGAIQKWEGTVGAMSARLGGNPPNATHVVAISQRLVVNTFGKSGQIQWSEPGETFGHETWPGLNFEELESRPDPLPALYANTGELVGGGTETVQVLDPDPDQIFATIRTWENGFGAPYSFAQTDETFGFVDSRRRIILSSGRSYQPISDPALTATLDDKALRIDDCWAFRAKIGSWNLLVFVFPTSGRTFVWDVTAKTWSEWKGWNGSDWAPFAGRSHVYWSDKNLHLIGLADGTIAQLDSDSITDVGQPIVAEVCSGFEDHNTPNAKQHISTLLTFRRGLGTAGRSPAPRCQLFWRDDTGPWEAPIELDLGDSDDMRPVIDVRSLGTYRVRQWRLRMSDSVPLTFVGAMETFEVLES